MAVPNAYPTEAWMTLPAGKSAAGTTLLTGMAVSTLADVVTAAVVAAFTTVVTPEASPGAPVPFARVPAAIVTGSAVAATLREVTAVPDASALDRTSPVGGS